MAVKTAALYHAQQSNWSRLDSQLAPSQSGGFIWSALLALGMLARINRRLAIGQVPENILSNLAVEAGCSANGNNWSATPKPTPRQISSAEWVAVHT